MRSTAGWRAAQRASSASSGSAGAASASAVAMQAAACSTKPQEDGGERPACR